MRVYLIGYMGSGKSKQGEALAKALRYTFYDTDKLIEEAEGVSISDFFKTRGQEEFRKVETKVLQDTLSLNNAVISTGGGMPAFEDNMQWMNDHGITVYLDANAGLLYHRLATNKTGRPLIEHLTDIELMEQISGHLATRLPFYRQAKITVSAADFDLKDLTAKIKKLSVQER